MFPSPLRPARRVLRWGLGLWWLSAAGLQLQPGMFQMDMIGTSMQPAPLAEPAWVTALLNRVGAVVNPHLWWANVVTALVEAVVGGLILLDLPGGPAVSAVWSAVVWVLGEAFGQVLTGAASFVTGAPGPALVALLLSLLLWRDTLQAARWMAAALFAYGAVQQVVPVFWTSLGAAGLYQGNAMMEPAWFAAGLSPVITLAARYPAAVNAASAAIMGALAWGLTADRPARAVYALAWIWLAWVWAAGQGFNMLLAGMAPNLGTAPLVALLLLPDRWLTQTTPRPAKGRPRLSPVPPASAPTPAPPDPGAGGEP
ncbi:conserved membrane protein of unknown function [Candidatus Hydrogenisulfobacillus filiaventi]|uniref:Uncharacterized protein n=1 Tax=Candidatus Hydrogenisulfobacillus filiaventi TaxID=2707344 RepID=A0A6F8ZE83_9FIRM|nr:hypothetical protein [Bacillota bacterium]CAB1128065.1 conserved membrane protein of unknown function [Candidatus Hydrogenisulfobacillus filiaventi]